MFIINIACMIVCDLTHRRTNADVLQTSAALAGLLQDESQMVSDTTLIDTAWRGAEAYHFYMLAQRQLYAGLLFFAINTLLRCSRPM
jgi:WD repeat-containing protein 35